ncbi:MAG TPA: hypothetical protein P5232_02745, partial [Candidatus Moranbacteria bacterium]|nr:hypothetical protein [Candidatus Moranbacteria bacterium]
MEFILTIPIAILSYLNKKIKKLFKYNKTKKRTRNNIKRKKHEISFPFYFNWKVKIILTKELKTLKRYCYPLKRNWQYISTTTLVIFLSIALIFWNSNLASATQYTFNQTSWAGSAGGATLTHPTSSSTNYASGSNMTLAANSATLSTTTNTFTQTSDTDFSGGTFSNTAQNGTTGSGASVGLATQQVSAIPVTQTFSYTGGVQSFTVPAGITSITITGNGAGGGAGAYTAGAAAGSSTGTLTVTPGTTYYILVGGAGSLGSSSEGVFLGGGYGGGGNVNNYNCSPFNGAGGGGMTWLSTFNTFAGGAPILVAGGGGGGSGYTPGGAGVGGGANGAAGTGGSTVAGGGTQSSGGAAGTGIFNGTVGNSGLGGNSTCSGGGGGGYYGGGGAGVAMFNYGGGGGGSGYLSPSLTGASTTQGGGAAAATNGSLTVTYYVSSKTFSYTGGVQSFTVPAGVAALGITANGAGGGNSSSGGSSGGAGGLSTGTLPVTPGTTYYILIGGAGATGSSGGATGGYGGGGNGTSTGTGGWHAGAGGGMTWLSTYNTFAGGTPLIVAGGGGGGSGYNAEYSGGTGGGSTGGNGLGGTVVAGGGAQGAGGNAGTGAFGNGSGGVSGVGGNGSAYGGGGGGGYYGGGGGGVAFFSYGSGGGGSGYLGASLTSTSTTQGGGASAATNGSLVLTAYGYQSSGTFTSSAINIGGYISGTFSWSSTLNSQTLTMQARSANNSGMTGADAWGSCSITSGAALSTSPCVHAGDTYIQYQASFSTNNPAQTPTLDSVTISTNAYNSSGSVISQKFDTTDGSNSIGELDFDQNVATLPTGTTASVSLRVATTEEGLDVATWHAFSASTPGCSLDGIIVTCPSDVINLLTNARYWQYKIDETSTGVNTPTIKSVTVKYVVNGPPEIQNVSASQEEDTGIVNISYQVKDQDTASITPSFEYWDGDSWETCITLSDGATDSIDTSSHDWSENQSLTWNAKTDFNNQFQNNTAKIRVTANDHELANSTTTVESSTFTLDTKSPIISNLTLNASTDPAEIAITSSDDSSYQMRIATGADLTACQTSLSAKSYETYDATPTIDLNEVDPSTICVQLKDQYSNTST